MSDEPPKRRVELHLEAHADSEEAMADVLRDVGERIEREGVLESVSGGYDSGYRYKATVNPEQTGDLYRLQLEAWRQERAARD